MLPASGDVFQKKSTHRGNNHQGIIWLTQCVALRGGALANKAAWRARAEPSSGAPDTNFDLSPTCGKQCPMGEIVVMGRWILVASGWDIRLPHQRSPPGSGWSASCGVQHVGGAADPRRGKERRLQSFVIPPSLPPSAHHRVQSEKIVGGMVIQLDSRNAITTQNKIGHRHHLSTTTQQAVVRFRVPRKMRVRICIVTWKRTSCRARLLG